MVNAIGEDMSLKLAFNLVLPAFYCGEFLPDHRPGCSDPWNSTVSISLDSLCDHLSTQPSLSVIHYKNEDMSTCHAYLSVFMILFNFWYEISNILKYPDFPYTPSVIFHNSICPWNANFYQDMQPLFLESSLPFLHSQSLTLATSILSSFGTIWSGEHDTV